MDQPWGVFVILHLPLLCSACCFRCSSRTLRLTVLKHFLSERETNVAQGSRITGVSGEAGSWNQTGSDSCFQEV